MAEFKMPALGADMESGTLVEWLVKPGDVVKRGDLVAVVETQKGAIDVEVFESGTIQELLVQVGEEVPVGTTLALIGGESEPVRKEEVERPPAVSGPVEPFSVPATTPGPAVQPARLRVSPVARRFASESGIDLATVTGTGPEGAVTLEDVKRASETVTAVPPAARSGGEQMLQAIAMAMARSKREIPHYYLGARIDMAKAVAWLEQQNTHRSVTNRLVYAALLIKAVALAVREVPEMNGFWVDGRFDQRDEVHIGVAIALRGGGLVAPAIQNVDKMSVDEVMVALRELVQRARAAHLRSSEITSPTITVTNLGEMGVDEVFGVIYPPQVALVGFGTLNRLPVVAGDEVAIHPVITASLSADHRASVGHRGARFLNQIDKLLQKPGEL